MIHYYDDKAAINITHNPVNHDRIIHINIDCPFIKELENGQLCPSMSPEQTSL